MQIHELTKKKQIELEEGLGSFVSGLTGGMSDKYTDKIPGGVKSGWVSSGVNPADYGAGYKTPSDKWEDKYDALQKDPAVASYIKSVSAGWAKNGPDLIKNTPVTNIASPAAGAGAFGQMATQLSTTGASSAGGRTQATPTGLTHTANPNNPNQSQATTISKTTNPVASAGVFGQMANQLSKATPPTAQPVTKISYGKAPAPGAVSEPVSLGGKQLNPKNPNDAQVLASIKKQGKLNEATAASAPNANQVKTAFVNWSDGQLATRVPETGATITMNDVRKLPSLTTKLSAALNQVVQTQGTPAQVSAVEEYVKLAVAGVQALAQSSKNGASAKGKKRGTAPNTGASNKATPGNALGKETPPGEEQPTAQTAPANPTMTRAQISQWISRNSEDHATLKAALDAINAVKV